MRNTKYKIQKTKNERRVTAQHASRRSDESRMNAGSALILAVVLTSLLAIIGTMFLMVARVDKISTSAISENKELNLAVDTVIAKISQELILDTPGTDPNDPNQEYYDYPDRYNRWLANLEPYDAGGGNYLWRRISDVYEDPVTGLGLLEWLGEDNDGINYWLDDSGEFVRAYNLRARIISPSEPVGGAEKKPTPTYPVSYGGPADADGDGVADSRWIELPNMTSSKGKPIFAAIRVIDNAGMLNVNTAYKFDPNVMESSQIDGSSQTQINLLALSKRGSNPNPEVRLQGFRAGLESDPNNIYLYKQNVVWRYDRPNGAYTPFDIADELVLRNRFLLNHPDIDIRIEEVWDNVFQSPNLQMPVTSGLADWFYRAQRNVPGPNDIYSYRHIGTTYTMDRIINPAGPILNYGKMVNVNRIYDQNDLGELYNAIWAGLYDANSPPVDRDQVAAQMAVNLKDFSDDDASVTIFRPSPSDPNYYGFERPCIFISELVCNSVKVTSGSGGGDEPLPPSYYRSYAIELRNRYPASNSDTWQLIINTPPNPPRIIDVNNFASDKRRYRVIVFEDPCAGLAEYVDFNDSPADGAIGVDPNVVLRWDPSWMTNADSYDVYFGIDYNDVRDANTTVDPNGVYMGRQTETSYDPYGPPPPGALDFNTTYYWRIDDVDANGNVIATGDVWSFTTWVTEPNVSVPTYVPGDIIFDVGSTIELRRYLTATEYIAVDSVTVPAWLVSGSADPNGVIRSFQRDITANKWIKRVWDDNARSQTLGHKNNYYADTKPIQVRFGRFNNVGEIGQVFRQNVYNWPWNENTNEAQVRIDLENFNYQQLFKYLTVFDPSRDGIDNDGDGFKDISDVNGPEWKVPGRININTAPWYVIAQLPWVSQKKNQPINYELAQAIVAYRDNTAGGFESIGELNRVVDTNSLGSIDYYWRGNGDQQGFPDLTVGRRTRRDGAPDDFEERDLIFSRISDLVTVRSDVFTAYILVRIGTDGPQKRVIAILDRSDVYPNGLGGIIGDVKVRALHPVPDPR